MFVLTVDQKGSRRSGDRVDALLRQLEAPPGTYVRGFERTAGDELQGVLDDPGSVVSLTVDLVRSGHWSIGIGIGAVRTPLPASTRAGHGEAFNLARTAVTRAKNRPAGVAVDGTDAERAAYAQSALDLLAAVVQRRSDRGWAAVDLVDQGLTQAQIGERLGISKQAVSQRLQAAEWHLEPGGRALSVHLLSAADAKVVPS